MSRALVDTDILSEILKNRDPVVTREAASYLATHGEFTVSVISVMEIAYGLHRGGRTKQLEAFEATLRATCNVLSFDTEMALLAGRIEAELETVGSVIDAPDVMIAAAAMRAGLPVVTGNTTHFEAIRRVGYALAIENWRRT